MNTHLASPAVETFEKYTQAFQSLDPKAVATHFNEPAMMITPDGVHVLPNTTAVEHAYARVMAELPAKRYARTEFSPLKERRLSDDLAELTCSGSWIDRSEQRFMSFGMTFTLRRA